MYEGSKAVVRCAAGITESFKVTVGLHSVESIPFCSDNGQANG